MSLTYNENQNISSVQDDKMLIVLYMFLLLSEYDSQIKNKEIPSSNPYIDRVTMPVDNGKYIEIPIAIQQFAIQKWVLSKENTKPQQKFKKVNDHIVDSKDGLIIHDSDCHCKSCDYKKGSYFTSIIHVMVCILIIVAIFYLLGCMRHNGARGLIN